MNTPIRSIAFLSILCGIQLLGTSDALAEKPDVGRIYGRIQFVNAFPDYKVKVTNAFADLHVQRVTAFPDKPGKWQIVNAFPDYKIQLVDSFPDFTIKYVNAFPGPQ